MQKNFYEILGVPLTVSKEDIVKAYRKLALKLHPDHGEQDDSRFKEIQKAYEVLRDPEKKEIYDRQFKKNIQFQSDRQGSDLQVDLKVKIRDLLHGIKKIIVIRRKGQCPSCNGTGSAEKTYAKCAYCDGTGLQGFQLLLGHRRNCKICNGVGSVPKGNPCSKCRGIGLIPEIVKHEIQLNPLSGSITIPGLGNCCSIRGKPGNLIINLIIEPDPLYKTNGLNVATTIELSPVQAILGDTLTLNIFGKEINLIIPSGTPHGSVIEKIGGGITYKEKIGVLKALIQIKIPTIISQTEREMYEKILEIEKETSWPKILRL